MKVNREELLRTLESLEPGRSEMDTLVQSSCFAFLGGMVYTFNDEVACRAPSPLDKRWEGAVHGGPLLEILNKLPEEVVDVSFSKSELRIKGTGRMVEVRLESEVLLPVEGLTTPEEWTELDEDFPEAVKLVKNCALSSRSEIHTKSVHLAPDFMEGTDGSQACRWRLPTGVKEDVLVLSESIGKVAGLGARWLSLDERWLHLKTKTDVAFSCRRYIDHYPDLSAAYEQEGEELILPKGLSLALEKAQVFSAEDKNNNQVLISLSPNRVTIQGIGIRGKYTEKKAVKYDGPKLAFFISPLVLNQMVERQTNFRVSPTKLYAEDGRYVYVASLIDPESLKHMTGRRGKEEEE